jgi:hypothetical protein
MGNEHKSRWIIPGILRGKYARIEANAGSSAVEAFTLRLKFQRGADELAEYILKPYLHKQGGKEFFVFEIPAEADHCESTVKFSQKAKEVTISSMRIVLEQPPAD